MISSCLESLPFRMIVDGGVCFAVRVMWQTKLSILLQTGIMSSSLRDNCVTNVFGTYICVEGY